MRASILTFIFIISEYSIITGGDGNCGAPQPVENAENVIIVTTTFRMTCKNGYVRKAGTSNLFKCTNNQWINNPRLKCMRNPLLPPPTTDVTTLIHTPYLPVTTSSTTQEGKSTSSVTGTVVFTTTHTASTTPWTSRPTSQRTTTMEETTVTTSITPRITSSSTTDKENPITVSSHSPSSLSTTSTGVSSNSSAVSRVMKTGITAGTLIVIIAGVAAIVAILLLRRRSRIHGAGGHAVEKKNDYTGSDHPLIKTQTNMSSSPPHSIPPPVTPFKDSPESTYTDATYSA